MKIVIFEDWLKYFNNKMKIMKKKVLLDSLLQKKKQMNIQH
jgi:hypothetical protein